MIAGSCFVSLAELKDFLGIASGTTTYDSLLNLLSVQSSVAIQNYCHRDFTLTAYEDKKDIELFQDTILVDHFPIVSVVALTEDGTGVSSSGYKLYNKSGKLVRVYGTGYKQDWNNGIEKPQAVQVYYTAGYASVPDDIVLATKQLVSMNYQARGNENLKSEKIGDYKYEKMDLGKGVPIPSNIQLTLDMYKKIW